MARTTPHKKLGNAIRACRTQKGLSQEDLAFEAGIHKTYLSSVEGGHRNLSLDIIVRIAKGLGISVEELFKLAQL